MYLIREVFDAKPGKAKDLVKMFKLAGVEFEKTGEVKAMKVMTDAVGKYWTVVVEMETDDIGKFFGNLRNSAMTPELQNIMKGYMECVEGGRREIFILE